MFFLEFFIKLSTSGQLHSYCSLKDTRIDYRKNYFSRDKTHVEAAVLREARVGTRVATTGTGHTLALCRNTRNRSRTDRSRGSGHWVCALHGELCSGNSGRPSRRVFVYGHV